MPALRTAASRYLPAFDTFIKVLAGLGLVVLSLVSIRDMDPVARSAELLTLEAIWAVFCLEVALRLALEGSDWWRYLGTWIGWYDLAAVLVPVAGLAAGLSPRDLALLCGVWIVKFARNNAALGLLQRVLANEARNLMTVACLFAVVTFTAALLAHVLERSSQPEAFGSIPAALWWAVTTLTTTGYGDAVPKSVGGRLLGGVVMTAGIGMFALWAGILAASFAREVRRHDFLRNWELVARVPLFTSLSAADLAEIVQILTPRTVRARTVICRKGEPGEKMYFIVKGAVQVAAVPPVRLEAGSYFGELALITGEPRTAKIVATEETSLLVLDIQDFRVLTARSPAMAAAITAEAERRLAAARTPHEVTTKAAEGPG